MARSDPPVFPGRIDPSDRFRERRRRARSRRRRRRLATFLVLVGSAVALALNARPGGERSQPAASDAPRTTTTAPAGQGEGFRPLPDEIRGVHVTMALASLPGKLDEYAALKRHGLNAIELDVKDENGKVAFRWPAVPLARETGAAGAYYSAKEAVAKLHAAGLYVIGRVVVFQDPVLASAHPELAIQTPGGGIWQTSGGLGWANPYDRRVWQYNVDVAAAAARAGFDEIMFDYVRFPSDGDVDSAVYRGRRSEPKWRTIADFAQYAADRLHPLGVRVSAAVFGLAATRELGIGQHPRLLARYVDTLYPMVYPSHFGSGQYQIADPEGEPGRTVSFALLDFRKSVQGRRAKLVPWLQDFSVTRPYSLADVAQQIDAARRARLVDRRVTGFLLWNATGVYTADALAP